MAATDYTDAWSEWESLFARRDRNPVTAAKEFLRREGWIVERPETLSLPVKVARSGGLTLEDGYSITLHVRADIGGRLYQVDYAVDARLANMSAKAPTSAIANSFSRAIMAELLPQIGIQCEQQIEQAKREAAKREAVV